MKREPVGRTVEAILGLVLVLLLVGCAAPEINDDEGEGPAGFVEPPSRVGPVDPVETPFQEWAVSAWGGPLDTEEPEFLQEGQFAAVACPPGQKQCGKGCCSSKGCCCSCRGSYSCRSNFGNKGCRYSCGMQTCYP